MKLALHLSYSLACSSHVNWLSGATSVQVADRSAAGMEGAGGG